MCHVGGHGHCKGKGDKANHLYIVFKNQSDGKNKHKLRKNCPKNEEVSKYSLVVLMCKFSFSSFEIGWTWVSE